MCVSDNEPARPDSCRWQHYDENLRWTLNPGPGLKTVYVLLEDYWGNTSSPLCASILLVR